MPNRAGFTLLEVLVALVIAALALGALFSGALTGLRATAVSARYEEAVSRARSHLAAVGHGGPLAPGDQRGEDGGGFRWRVRTVALTSAPVFGEADPARAPLVILYGVTVAISWEGDGRPRTVTLATARVGLAAPAAP